MNQIQKINREIVKAKKILIASHQNPEGDAIGSTLALYHHFSSGRKIQMLNLDKLPYFLEFLPGSEKIFHSLEHIRPDFELAIIVDCTDPTRVGANFWELLKGKKVINIDHHESNRFFGELNFVQPEISSTGEIIFTLLKNSGKKLSARTATCLYTAIMMDTGSFRYSNTSKNTLAIASELVALGAKPGEISKQVYENHPPAWLKLISMALSTHQISASGKRAEMTLTSAMFRKSGAGKEMSEGLINYLMMLRGVEVGILYRQISKNKYKVSFRSAGKVNVAKLSEALGGGGHKQAAGATMEGNLKDIQARVRILVDDVIKKL